MNDTDDLMAPPAGGIEARRQMRDKAVVTDQFVEQTQLLPAVLNDKKNGTTRMIPHHVEDDPRLLEGERCADVSALRRAENGNRLAFERRFAVKQRTVEIDPVALAEQVGKKPFQALA